MKYSLENVVVTAPDENRIKNFAASRVGPRLIDAGRRPSQIAQCSLIEGAQRKIKYAKIVRLIRWQKM